MSELEKIVAAASRRCDVHISREDLSAIKAARGKTPLTQWIHQNLTPETLLSHEELNLWNHLSKTGVPETLGEDGFTLDVPQTEEQLLAEIADLENSTAAINRQVDILQSQQTIMEAQRKRKVRQDQDNRSFAEQIEQRNVANIQRLTSSIKEASDHLDHLFSDSEIDKTSRRTPSMVTEQLNADDRILEQLQNATSIPHGDLPPSNIEFTDRLVELLSKTRADEVHTRLDRIFLEALIRYSPPDEIEAPTIEEDLRGLENDLQSLYSEIPDVVEMTVSQEYKHALVQAIRQEESLRNSARNTQEETVRHKLSVMTANLEELTERIESFSSYRSTLHAMQSGFLELDAVSRARSTPRPVEQAITRVPQATEVILRQAGVNFQESHMEHEVIAAIEAKILRLRSVIRASKAGIEEDGLTTLSQRRKAIALLSYAQESDDAKAQLHTLDERLDKLRGDVEDLVNRDLSQDRREQQRFVERWQ